MMGWFSQEESLRARLVFAFLSRPESDRPTVTAFMKTQAGGAPLIFRLAVSDPTAIQAAREMLVQGGFVDRLLVANMAAILRLKDCVPEMWTLVDREDPQRYPFDAKLRHAALKAILRVELAKSPSSRPAPSSQP
jgi:hypothetical protein